jgi:L-fuculose-phosphate aldolase
MNWMEQRLAIVEVCRRMYERRFISGGQGNVSMRLPDSTILITPSGVNKGFLKPEDLVTADMNGDATDKGTASSEIKVHLAAYNRRPDCGAVVHAHPASSVALTLAGVSLEPVYLPESVITLGIIPTSPYNTPSSIELAEGIEKLAGDHNVLMMERHGAVCLGANPWQAYDRLESLEHNSLIILLARIIGQPQPLSENEIARLKAMAASTLLQP